MLSDVPMPRFARRVDDYRPDFVDTVPAVDVVPAANDATSNDLSERVSAAWENGRVWAESDAYVKGWRMGVFHGAFAGVVLTLGVLKIIATVLS